MDKPITNSDPKYHLVPNRKSQFVGMHTFRHYNEPQINVVPGIPPPYCGKHFKIRTGLHFFLKKQSTYSYLNTPSDF